jgi:hypothetical protein
VGRARLDSNLRPADVRVLESMEEVFWDPEIERRGGAEVTGPIVKALGILRPGQPVEVRLDEEVDLIAKARPNTAASAHSPPKGRSIVSRDNEPFDGGEVAAIEARMFALLAAEAQDQEDSPSAAHHQLIVWRDHEQVRGRAEALGVMSQTLEAELDGRTDEAADGDQP